jgi:hypothetical protein
MFHSALVLCWVFHSSVVTYLVCLIVHSSPLPWCLVGVPPATVIVTSDTWIQLSALSQNYVHAEIFLVTITNVHYVYTRTYTVLYTHSRPLLARAPVSVHSLAYTPWHTHFRKCRAGKGNRRLHLPHSSIFSEQVLAWGLQTILKACVQHVCGSPETALQFKEFIHRCAISIKFF